ncbi:porin [Patescibacteria group bacterium]|nr:porin [Patescibacteria group bacterium]
MKKKAILSTILIGCAGSLFAQDTANKEKDPLSISGYVEAYYSYDFAKPADHKRPSFIYSHNRSNEVQLNLGFIKAAYQTPKVRANLALATGTYMNANYASEPDVLKNIYEANVGVKISKNKNLWVDAGIFVSHLGFESAVGANNWTLTRSLFAENSPYFETGAKISFTSDNGKWFLSGLVLNGWQRIQRVDGNNMPAFGHQITFTPNSNITLNSGSFIGSVSADSIGKMRYFHNFYGIFQLSKTFALTIGFDIGAQQASHGSDHYNIWYSPVLLARFKLNKKHSITLRSEYYNDENGVIIATGTPNGFQTVGYSLNYDYHILDNVMWRIELRGFSSKDKIFILNENPGTNNFAITTALAISF